MKKGLLFFSLIFLIACELFARVTITGQVKNATGESFPRASVAVNVTKLGTETKVDGKYSIIVPPNTTPVFSFIGMLKEEKPVGIQATIDVAMMENITTLKDVVVVGYDTQKKANMTSVAQLTNLSKKQYLIY
ncbi:MAG TPA: carboxypeptidase-like regulatory domain-containing protein [Bacteroidales bacterium]